MILEDDIGFESIGSGGREREGLETVAIGDYSASTGRNGLGLRRNLEMKLRKLRIE
jgi:hypothetical protein